MTKEGAARQTKNQHHRTTRTLLLMHPMSVVLLLCLCFAC